MDNTTEMNLRELLQSLDWNMAQLQRATGISKQRMYGTIALQGNATLREIQSIAKQLDCDTQQIVSVLAETARRPGDRDPRGRTKDTAESNTVGGSNGNRGHGGAEHVALDSDGSAEGREPGGDGTALPAEAAAGLDQSLRQG